VHISDDIEEQDVYKMALENLDKARMECDGAEQYQKEIMRIFAKYGFLEGEWSCSVDGRS